MEYSIPDGYTEREAREFIERLKEDDAPIDDLQGILDVLEEEIESEGHPLQKW